MVLIETLKSFYHDIAEIVTILFKNPYTLLLAFGLLLLLISIILIITRNNYTRIVNMIDEGEEQAINKRIGEWGEMIVNNVQQDCMERKLKLTLYVFILLLLSILIIFFSFYNLDELPYLIIIVIHLFVLFSIIFIFKCLIRKKKRKKINSKEKNKRKKVNSEENK